MDSRKGHILPCFNLGLVLDVPARGDIDAFQRDYPAAVQGSIMPRRYVHTMMGTDVRLVRNASPGTDINVLLRLDDRLIQEIPAGVDADIGSGRHGPVIKLDAACRFQRHVIFSRGIARLLDCRTFGADGDRPCFRRNSRIDDLSIGGHFQILPAGQLTAQVDAHALLCAHQSDAPRRDAAQKHAVHAQSGGVRIRQIARCKFTRFSVIIPVARLEVQLIGVDLGIYFCGPRNDLEEIYVPSVQSGSFYIHLPCGIHVQAHEIAVPHLRPARSQQDSGSVDELAAIAGDAVRIGQDVFRCPPMDLGGAQEPALPSAGDFIQDDPRAFLSGDQVRVGVDGSS